MGPEGRIAALVMAAGSGIRSGGDLPKQYRPIAGRAMLSRAVDSLSHARIDEVQVVIGVGHEALYEAAVGDRPLPAPVAGGATRQESVRRGLDALAVRQPVAVLIHDAARPFVPGPVIDRLLAALQDSDGAVPVLPVADTLARGGEMLGEAVPRDGIVRVQTPQAFRFEAIVAAHRNWSGNADATDDAQVARAAGMSVATVGGDPALEKLTFDEDFRRAEARTRAGMLPRTGIGLDAHAFEDGDHVWLGGVRIAHNRGLAGHSDADVVLHAVADALLGAAGAGDLGEHFPPSDPQWRGAPSSQFVAHARSLIEASGGMVDHVDVTIVCQAPRLGPHRQAMRERMAELLALPLERVSVKATTTDGLGFTGRGEGVAAQAVATVRMGDSK